MDGGAVDNLRTEIKKSGTSTDEKGLCSENVGFLLRNYRDNGNPARDTHKLKFINIGKNTVYNPTAPFMIDNTSYMAARIEPLDDETNSKVMFFTEKGTNQWAPSPRAPVFNLQDPFVTRVEGKLVFGGVKFPAGKDSEGKPTWKTILYQGPNIRHLTEFAQGPSGMKNIRIVELHDKRIGVFTRPQGAIGGKGKIGFMVVDNLNDLSQLRGENYLNASLIGGIFTDEDWGGVNEIHLLGGSELGVLGHIACFDHDGNKHYYPIAFRFDYISKKVSELQIIATRREFSSGNVKRPELEDVLFSGGLVRNPNGTAKLYVGVSDAEVHSSTIQASFVLNQVSTP